MSEAACMPQPKAPSSLIKVSRWTLLTLGIVYGFQRRRYLTKKETELRRIEEEERPARETALKAEKEARNMAEMGYLGKEVGITRKGGSGSGGSSGSGADCGCKY